jgi:hypothetical protein
MINKVIKIGSGLGPVIDCRRYTDVALHVNGLAKGELFVITSAGDRSCTADGIIQLNEIDTVQIEVVSPKRSSVTVRLTARGRECLIA